MNNELKLKLESHEFSAMYELVADILQKVSGGNLHKCDAFQKVFSPYLLCRYISMREDLIDYAHLLNVVNSNSKLTNEQFYKFAYNLIPKQRNGYIKYIKKPEKKKSKQKEDENFELSFEQRTSLFDL